MSVVLPQLPYGRLPADQIVPALPKRVWFNSVGQPLSEGEREESLLYLQGLGATHDNCLTLANWEDAAALAAKPNWHAPYWERERAEERRLFELASQQHSADALLLRLANLMQGSATLFHSSASVACARAGIVDEGIAHAASGAAAQCLHQYGLVSITGQGEAHFFAAKFRLFLAGRWPLCVTTEQFFVF
jgi:hypothetical protein